MLRLSQNNTKGLEAFGSFSLFHKNPMLFHTHFFFLSLFDFSVLFVANETADEFISRNFKHIATALPSPDSDFVLKVSHSLRFLSSLNFEFKNQSSVLIKIIFSTSHSFGCLL